MASDLARAVGARRGGGIVRRFSSAVLAVLAAAAALAQVAPAPTTLPTGGQVVQGQANLRGAGSTAAPVLNIDQASQRAVINWGTFNLGAAATVNFNQPNAQAATLNRVQDMNLSQIFGHINAPGQVTLINPAGVYFSPGAVLDVGALTATTLQQSDADFMAGGANFTRSGSSGSVVNAGSLQAALGGYIALLAPEVRNEGLIVAQQGTVALASGEAIRLNFDPQSRLTSMTVTPSQIAALVENKTAVQVGGGQILLSATAVSGLQGSVVNSGSLSASSLTAKGGRIVLEGDSVTLAPGSSMAATGATGGGTVLVGGDWQGAAGTYQATTVTMAGDASIDASATQSGDGGKVVLWSDVGNANSSTTVNGSISVRGGALGGNGGKVETSGHAVDSSGARINAGADQGTGGLWLIDPADLTIDQTIANGYQTTLNGGGSVLNDVTGNLTWNSGVTLNKTGGGAATLTLRTTNNGSITLNNASITSTSNPLNLVLWTRYNDEGRSGFIFLNGGNISTNGGNVSLSGGIEDPTLWHGLSVGGAYANTYASGGHGINLTGTTINTGGGNIQIKGQSYYTGGTTGNSYGVVIAGGSSLTTTNTGTIDIVGDVRGTYTHGSGVVIGSSTAAGNVTIASDSGAINITGTGADQGGSGTGWRHAVVVKADNSDQVAIKSTSGAITLNGAANFNASNFTDGDSSGLQFQTNTTGSGIQVVSQTGAISLIGSNTLEATAQDVNGIRFTAVDAPNSIRIGYDGSNAYSGNILIQSNSIEQRNNNAGVGSLSVQSTGTLTVQSAGNAFTYLRAGSGTLTFDNDWNFGTGLSAFTLGKSTNAPDLTLSNALTTAGPISLYGGNITLNGALNTSAGGANGDVLAKATGSIKATANLSTNGGDVVLWADSDANNMGSVFLDNNSIATKGGSLWAGGGAAGGSFNGLAVGSGYATSSSNSLSNEGVVLHGTTIDTTNGAAVGGSVSLKGKNDRVNGAETRFGVLIDNSSNISTGVGSITVDGTMTALQPGSNYPSLRGTQIDTATLQTTTGDITVTGSRQGYNQNAAGVMIRNATVQTTGATGNISITGTQGDTDSGTNSGTLFQYGTYVQADGANAATTIKTNGGNILLSGTNKSTSQPNSGGSAGLMLLSTEPAAGDTTNPVLKVVSATGNVTLKGDNPNNTSTASYGLQVNGTNYGKVYLGYDGTTAYSGSTDIQGRSFIQQNFAPGYLFLQGSGALTIEPLASSNASFVTGASTPLAISFDGTYNFGTSHSSVNLGGASGNTGNTSDITVSNALTAAGPISVYGGNIALNANLSTTAGAILAKGSGNVSTGNNQVLQTNGGAITLWADSDANGGYILLNESTKLDSRTAAARTTNDESTNATTATGGGDITLGGGNGATAAAGYAWSAGTAERGGVNFGDQTYNNNAHTNLTTLYSGGGNIVVRGKQTVGTMMGINWVNGGTLNAGTGTVTLDGTSVGGHGMEIGSWQGSGSANIYAGGGSAGTPAITLTGANTTAGSKAVQTNVGSFVSNGAGGIGITGSASGSGSGAVALGLSNLTSTVSGAAINVRATGSITTNNAITVATNNGALLLASDTDNSSGGIFRATGAFTANTTGGAIAIGGGDANGTGYATGSAADGVNANGVRFGGTTALNSGNGNIAIKGKSFTSGGNGGNAAAGIWTDGNFSVNSGTGTVNLEGVGQAASTSDYTMGMMFGGGSTGTTSITSANTTANAIKLIGNAAAAGNSAMNSGFRFYTNGTSITATGLGGGITLEGTRNTAGNTNDFSFADSSGTGTTSSILANGGPINLNGKTTGGQIFMGAMTLGRKLSTTVTSSISNVTITADGLNNILSGTAVNTSGTLTVQPFSNNFSSALTWPITNLALSSDVSGLTLGKDIGSTAHTDTITVGSATSIAGPINIYGGTVNLNANLVSTAAGSPIFVKASGDIATAGGVSGTPRIVQTNNGAITLWSDADVSAAGAINLGSYTTLNSANGSTSQATGGGNITLGGGAGTTTPTGYATGNTTGSLNFGVYINDNDALYSGGGNIAIKGQSAASTATTTQLRGVQLTSSVVDSGQGTIGIEGTTAASNNTTNARSAGVHLSVQGNFPTRITSANTSASAITVIGDASASTVDGASGIVTYYSDLSNNISNTIAATGTGGGVTFTGKGGSSSAGTDPVGDGIELNYVNILAKTGPIVLNGTTAAASNTAGISLGRRNTVNNAVNIGQAAGLTVNGVSMASSSSAITLNTDKLSFNAGGSSATTNKLASAGALTVKPFTAGTTIGIGGGAGTLQVPATAFANSFTDGFSSITVGRSDGTGAINVGALTTTDNLTILSNTGAVSLAGALNAGTNTVTLQTTGTVTESGSGAVTAGNLLLQGESSVAMAGANAVSTLAASGVGNVSYTNSGALTVGTVAGTTGLNSTGTLAINTTSGHLTLAQNIATTDATASAVVLNAGVSASAGTSAGGNIVLSGSPTITVGTGGRATLYTGAVAGSTGLAALVGSGSGKFRYNSDEGTTNFSPTLSGGGTFAIYREQPTATLTGATTSMVYGGTVPTLATVSDVVNGDVITPTATVGGSTSTSGNYTVAGPHSVTPTTAALTALGYAVSVTNGALTVTAAPLTVSGSTASNKVYDKTTTAAVTGGTLVGLVGSDVVTLNQAGNFATANVGSAIAVTTSDSMGGTDVGNYTLTQPTGLSANITPKTLTVSGSTANDKVYDRNTTASITNGTLVGVISGDTVTLAQAGNFASANVGSGITVSTSDTIGGTDVGNYTLTQPTGLSANITPKTLTVTGSTASDKVYDRNTTASITNGTLVGVISGDTVTLAQAGSFASANVGSGITVSTSDTIGGTDVGNYTLTQPTGLSANITPKALTVTGSTANDKVYDRNTTASITNGTLVGVISGDTVTLAQAGSFASANVGSGITVSASDTIGGTDVGNYTLTQPTGLSANITPKTLTVSGSTANDKVYDRSTTASITNGTLVGVISGDAVTLTQAGNFASANVGSGITVSTSDTIGGTDVGNYTLTQPTGLSANITPKTLTVTGSTTSDKVYDRSTTASITNGTLVGVISGDAVTLTQAGNFASANVGTGITVSTSDTIGGTDVGNYTLTQPTGLSANITPKALTVTGSTANDKVYDRSTTASITNGTLVGVISGDTVTLAQAGNFASANVGTGITVSASDTIGGTDVGNYTLTQPTGLSANITPKALTVTGSTANDKVYDRSTTASITNGTLVGVISGDAVTLAQAGSFASANVGTGITVSTSDTIGGTDVGNYTLTQPTTGLSANITPKALTVTGSTASDKVYDRSTTASITNGTLVGVISGDAVTLAQAGSFASANVGTGITVSASDTIGGTDVGNYTLTQPTGLSANITPKTLTVTGSTANDKVYDRSTTASITNGTLVGVISGDAVTLAQAGNFATANAGTGITVSTSDTIGGTDVGNYTLTQPTGLSANITPKTLTVTGSTANDKVYDRSTTASITNGTLVGVISGDTVTLTQAGSFASANVGSGITVSASDTIGGTDVGNYTLTQPTGLSANITPKALTVTGSTASDKVYDRSTTASITNGTLVGVILGDNVTLTQTGSFASMHVGSSIAVTATDTLGGNDYANYTVTQPIGLSAAITPKALTVAGITAANKVYDASAAADVNTANAVYTGLIAGDSITVSATGAFGDKNVGNGKTVDLISSYAGTALDNYSVTDQATTTASITPKTLTVSGITVADKAYDATTGAAVSTAGVNYAGLIAGDRVSLSTTGVFSDKNVGTAKTVNLSSSHIGADVGNYSITDQTSSTATISPAALTVTANADARFVTKPDVAGFNGVSYTGLVGGETGSVLGGSLAITRPNAGADEAAGTYAGALVPSGYTSNNYNISYANGNFTIVAANTLLIRAANTSATYGASPNLSVLSAQYLDSSNNTIQTLTGGGSGGSFSYTDGLGGGASFVLSPAAATSSTAGKTVVGNYALSDANPTIVGSNFNQLVFVGNLAVTPKAVTATATGVSKQYDGTTAMTDVTLALIGKEGNDVLAVSGAGAFAQKNVGSGLGYTVSGLALGGADAGNYILSNSGSFTGNDGAITPKALTVAGSTAASKIYDRTTAATITNGTLVGVVSGDTVTLAQAGSFASANVGTGISVNTADTIGGTGVGNYTLTQPTGLSANITPKTLTVTGSTASDKVYDRSTTASITNGTLVGVISGDTVTLAQAGSFASANVGTGITVSASDTIGGTDVGNYTLTQPTGLSANITPKTLTVTGSTASDKVYDRNTTASITNGTLVGVISGDAVTLAQAGSFATANAGTGITVNTSDTIGGTDVGNYTLTQPTTGLSANITPKALTVTGSTASDKVYDRSTTASITNGTLVGVISGDTVTLAQAGSFATANAGTGITVSTSDTIGGTDVGNYTLTQPTGLSANITPKALTVTGSTASDKVYDRSTTASITNGTLVGVISGDAVTLTQAGNFASANVGSGITVSTSDTIGGADVGNYTLTQPTGLSANITPKVLSLQGASGLSKTYDGGAQLPGAGYGVLTGAIAGDEVLAQGAAAYATPSAGSQAIVQGSVGLAGASAGNYQLVWVNGAGTISPATLTMAANNDARFVSQADLAGYNGVRYSGFVNGETSAVLAGSAVVTRSNPGSSGAGSYTDVLVPGGVTAGNYTITFVPGSYTIVPANQLLVRVPNAQTVYGSSATYGAVQASYLANDGTTIVDLSGSVSANGNRFSVGDGSGSSASFSVVPVNARLSSGGALAVGGYQLGASQVTAAGGNFSDNLVVVGAQQVDAKGITLAASGVSKVYDGTKGMTDLQLGATGLLAGDSATPIGSGEFATRHAGSGLAYSVTDLHFSGADAGNYYIIGGTARTGTDGVISPKPVTLTAPTVSKVYDGSAIDAADAATLAGLTQQLGVAGDVVSNIALVFADKNVGTGKTLAAGTATIVDGNGGNNYLPSYAANQASSITRLASVAWVGGSTGNWFDPANWAGGAVPDLANVAKVVIPANVTVSFGASVVAPAQAGPVQIDGLGTAGALDLHGGQLLVGSGGVALSALTQSGGGLRSDGNVALGSFDQSGGSLVAGGNFSTASNFAQTGAGSVVVGGSASIVDTQGGVSLGNLSSSGPLSVVSSDGPISQQTGTVVTAGSSSALTATQGGTPADITLQGANQLGGPVSASGANIAVNNAGPLTLASVIASGNLTLQSQGALNLGTSQVGGKLTASSAGADIYQSGPLKVGGSATVDAGSGKVQLVDAGNLFGSATHISGDKVTVFNPAESSIAPVSAAQTAGAMQAGLSGRTNVAAGQALLASPCRVAMQWLGMDGASGVASAQALSGGGGLRGAALSLALPEAATSSLRAQPGSPTARSADGAALPSWLAFDAERMQFNAAAVPAGALPLEVTVSVGDNPVRLRIEARTAGAGACSL